MCLQHKHCRSCQYLIYPGLLAVDFGFIWKWKFSFLGGSRKNNKEFLREVWSGQGRLAWNTRVRNLNKAGRSSVPRDFWTVAAIMFPSFSSLPRKLNAFCSLLSVYGAPPLTTSSCLCYSWMNSMWARSLWRRWPLPGSMTTSRSPF